jgi:pimeloyl-ACP methyl ester carboxylesterase
VQPNSALFMLFATLLVVQPGHAAVCDPEDYELRVSGASQCLVMRRFGTTEPDVMIVWLHGDVSSGGPATYHFDSAERAVRELSANRVLSVALVRPGYPDGSGNTSSVGSTGSRRSDHYTRENITEVGAAIERLRIRYKPRTLIVVGHSGGAATAAVLLGLKPKLIDGVVLVACPCDVIAWRRVRGREWPNSESPIEWADKVDTATRVIALTGERDDNTSTDLARAYVRALEARKVSATFQSLANETHNGSFRSAAVMNAVRALAVSKSP